MFNKEVPLKNKQTKNTSTVEKNNLTKFVPVARRATQSLRE